MGATSINVELVFMVFVLIDIGESIVNGCNIYKC